MEALRNMSGFLGTNASLLADINLVVHILFMLVLSLGVVVQLSANRGKPHLYPWHDRLQAPVVVLNILFIIFVMIPAFAFVLPRIPGELGDPTVLVPTLHALLGLVAEGLGIYCLLAGFRILPRKIGVLRYWMWAAFIAWTLATVFGIGIYLIWYTGSPSGGPLVAEHDAEIIEIAPTDAPEIVEEHAEEPVVIEATEPPTDEIVEEHAEEPVEIPPTPSPEATATQPAAEEEAAPAGLLRFSDGEIHSDRVTLQLQGVAPAGADSVYVGWLQSEDGSPFSLGALPVQGDVIDFMFQDPEQRRLLDSYNGAFITLEPAGGDYAAPSGDTVYAGQVAPAAMAHVRHVVTAFPGSPDGDGLALNALSDAIRIIELVDVQQRYVNENNLVDLKIHAENTINILEGTDGPNHGDLDADGETYTGDGFGLLRFGESDGYLQTAADHATLASQSEGASARLQAHAGNVNILAQTAIERALQIRDLQLQILQVANAADAAGLVVESLELANALVNGLDGDGDGQVESIAGEGGVFSLYEQGQRMGSIELFALEGVSAPAAEPTPTPELISEHDGDVAEVVEPEFTGESAQAEWLQLTAANTGPGQRFEHGMQYSPATNQVFLFGGRDGSQDYNDTWALDLADLSWRQLAVNSPTAPPSRHNMVMIVDDAAQSLYVAAGQGPGGVLGDIWRLDLTTETWEDLSGAAGAGPANRYGSPGGNLGNNLLLTHGFGNTRYDDTWLFDTGSGQWQQIATTGPVPLRRCLFAATVAEDNLVMHGGCASGFGDCFLDDTWVLDTAASTWREVTSEVRPVGRQHQTLVSVSGQAQSVLYGGEDASRSARDDVWLLDLATGSWQPVETSSSPGGRYNHAAVWASSVGGRPAGMLVYGGRSDSSTALGDLWLLNLGGAPAEAAPVPTAPPPQTPTATPELVSEHDGG